MRAYRRESSDSFIEFLRARCEKEPAIECAILFGSRARGDAINISDFDLAFVAPTMTDDTWALFCSILRETAPTLCNLDLIRADKPMREELRHHIFSEGSVVYERRKN